MAKGFKTGGRAPGTPNKVSVELRDMILGALEDAGGRDYLAKQAAGNPSAFLSLVGRCLPKDMNLGGEGMLTLAALITQAARPAEPEREPQRPN